MALRYHLLRLVPISILLRTLQIRAVVPVQILENTILVFQSTKVRPLGRRRRILDCGKSSGLLCWRKGRSGGGGAWEDAGRKGGDGLG